MTFNDIFKSNFIENVTAISPLDMVLTLILAFELGIFIFSSGQLLPVSFLLQA